MNNIIILFLVTIIIKIITDSIKEHYDYKKTELNNKKEIVKEIRKTIAEDEARKSNKECKIQHRLKINSKYFKDVVAGIKTFELRINDRDYQVGDLLLLEEIEKDDYTGKTITKEITYILDDAKKYGLKKGYCILGISDVLDEEKYTIISN